MNWVVRIADDAQLIIQNLPDRTFRQVCANPGCWNRSGVTARTTTGAISARRAKSLFRHALRCPYLIASKHSQWHTMVDCSKRSRRGCINL